ncbi:hypothetical protein FRB93_002952 [Tulasnella sp. JGI-2019a]|nr:hypothetical protein FRB93_002952 [Tulasnella sp. JGI-2019a]
MFGPFGGPLPHGKYSIRLGNNALQVPIILNHTVVTMVAFEERNVYQVWALEYGTRGYKIKHEASGNYLSYTPWAIPARIIGQMNHITASADSPVEWQLVQTSTATTPRTFQLRIIAGFELQPSDNIALTWNGNIFPTAGASGASFTFRGTGSIEESVPSSLAIRNNTRCRIRSVYSPHIALELRPSIGNLVVGRAVTNEDSQVWTFLSGGRGFRIRNLQAQDNLGAAVVPHTPVNTQNQTMVCRPDTSTEYTVVQSTEGYELRLASNPTLLITIWNLDAGNNSWIYLDRGSSNGNADTNQQWIFTQPAS